LVEVIQSVLVTADPNEMVAHGVVGFGQVRIQPQRFTIVLNGRILIAESLEARA
jgi:hypothetical protein